MRALRTPDEVAELTADPLLRWAAQALRPDFPHGPGSAHCLGDAVAVHAPLLNQRNRLVFTGSPESCAALLAPWERWLRENRVHPLSDTDRSRAVAERLPWLRVAARFGWMDFERPVAVPARPAVEFLPPEADSEVAALLDEANPHSWVRPGEPGARRWAGVRDVSGQLVSVAADAWSASFPDHAGVGFIAGVATRPEQRGRGLSRAVCGFLTKALRRELGGVSLMVDESNAPARAVYERLGFRYRSMTALSGFVAPTDRSA